MAPNAEYGLSLFQGWAEKHLRIRNKAGEIVPFSLNSAQIEVDKLIEEAEREGRPARIIILKARQLGFSTYSIGRGYKETSTKPANEAFLVAHDDESTGDLFERARLMHDLNPAQPMTRYSNKKELDFANPDRRQAQKNPGLMSRFRLGTAGKLSVGRSKTIRYLHCSEVAFWRDAKTVLLGLEQCVPRLPGTAIILESTANGVGGEFHKRWKLYSNPQTRGIWRAIFFAWWREPSYSLPLVDGLMYPIPTCVENVADFLEEEAMLKREFKLTAEQINWRRAGIVELCGNDLSRFRQEYPSTPDEAFLTSGHPVFNRARLESRRLKLEGEDERRRDEASTPRMIRGRLIEDSRMVRFVRDPEGPLRVYRWPEQRREYWIGADSAQGIVSGDDPDYAAAQVIERLAGEQVATFQARVPPNELARMLELLGYWYLNAYLVPESNNHGHTVIELLKRARYPRIWMRQDFDVVGVEKLERYGWETNAKTRPLMVDAVGTQINEKAITLNDIPTINECITFVRDPKTGKPQADIDCKDDLVMSLGVVLAAMQHGVEQMQPYSSPVERNLSPDAVMVSKKLQEHIRAVQEHQRNINGQGVY